MHWFTTCDCCGRSSLLPAFTITEAGSARRHVVCIRCASHVGLRDDGTLALGAPCPEHLMDGAARPRPALRHADNDSTTGAALNR